MGTASTCLTPGAAACVMLLPPWVEEHHSSSSVPNAEEGTAADVPHSRSQESHIQ